jgi:5-dehydro-4-deoxyglucarate dehydratase
MSERSRRRFVKDLALAAGTLALSPLASCQAAPAPRMDRDRKDLIRALQGVHNFMVTTFHSNFELDSEGLRRNVADHARGYHEKMTIVVAGGLGELYSLDIEEHRALVTAAVAGADGKMPVVAGVGGGYRNALSMARNAEQSGADAVLVFPPGSRWGLEEGTYRCCLDVAKAVNIGVLIYPRAEEYWPRLLKRLAQVENIIGFKDPSGHTKVGLALGDLIPDNFLWIAEGEGHAVKTLPVGGRAYTTAVATFVPQASHAFWKHGVAGDKQKMNHVLQNQIEPVVKLRGVQPGYGVSAIKVALESLGRAGGPVRPPGTQVAEKDQSIIAEIARSHSEVRREG